MMLYMVVLKPIDSCSLEKVEGAYEVKKQDKISI